MSLNIKDPETHKLAQLLAEETGESMTQAVTDALKEKLRHVRRSKRSAAIAEELRAIAKRFRSHLKGRPVEDHGAFLYDERGLPK
jgi:antitoxin VapB